MDVGLAFPQMTPDLDRDRVRAWCRLVDDGPFSSLSAGERIAFDNLDAFSLCTAAAALTDRVRVLFNVIVGPWHHPAMLAKQLLSVDAVAGGRVEVGLGVGGREQDYAALDTTPAGRFGRLDHVATELRRIFAGGEVVPGAGVGPVSPQPGGPPLYGSGTGPRSLARTAAWADGITHFTLGAQPDEAAGVFALAEAAWRNAGRVDAPRRLTGSFVVLGGGDARDRLQTFARRYLDVFGTDIAAWLAEQMPLHTPRGTRDVPGGPGRHRLRRGDPGARRQRPRPGPPHRRGGGVGDGPPRPPAVGRGRVSDGARVRAALAAVDRRGFLPAHEQRFADLDRPLPIGHDQTNSQPRTVADMLALLDVPVGARVLDVGAGSGWTTALLGWLVGPAGRVVGVERVPELATWGAGNLAATAMGWATEELADPLVLGRPDLAPFDRILVSADAPTLPDDLVEQLGAPGRMVIPVRGRMLVVTVAANGSTEVTEHGRYAFVPLIVPG